MEKRRRILDAARDVILASGLRGATMEGIAKAAGIAKPTLYGQFSDKEAIFEALIEDLVAAKTQVFLAAFESDGPLEDRVAVALSDMFGQIADMLEGSAHAAELVSEPHRFAYRLKRADDLVSEKLTAALADNQIADPAGLAKILLASGTGIVGKYSGGVDVRAAVDRLARTLLRGARAH